ncbi:hypothetical protein DN41_2874 [Vibrio cholerae]|nr:hypothetical protein DN41_2874 [Vibrio cholerae]
MSSTTSTNPFFLYLNTKALLKSAFGFSGLKKELKHLFQTIQHIECLAWRQFIGIQLR